MKVIVRTSDLGVINDTVIERDSPIWVQKEKDGALRLYVYEEDTEVDIAWFAPGWRSAVVEQDGPGETYFKAPDEA